MRPRTNGANTTYSQANEFSINFAYIQLGGLRIGKDESAFTTYLGYAGGVINDCGNGEVSGAFTVTLYTTQGMDENPIGKIRVYPNPNNGTSTLEISTLAARSLEIRLVNALGETVYRADNVRVDGDARQVINAGANASGMMILQVSDGQDTWSGKVYIEK